MFSFKSISQYVHFKLCSVKGTFTCPKRSPWVSLYLKEHLILFVYWGFLFLGRLSRQSFKEQVLENGFPPKQIK